MAAADSFVGEGLAPSPYAEERALREAADRLCRLYERVIDLKNADIERLLTRIRQLEATSCGR